MLERRMWQKKKREQRAEGKEKGGDRNDDSWKKKAIAPWCVCVIDGQALRKL